MGNSLLIEVCTVSGVPGWGLGLVVEERDLDVDVKSRCREGVCLWFL